MTTHDMILLCSSLQRAFVFGARFCHLCSFWKIWVPPTDGSKHAAASRSTANFS